MQLHMRSQPVGSIASMIDKRKLQKRDLALHPGLSALVDLGEAPLVRAGAPHRLDGGKRVTKGTRRQLQNQRHQHSIYWSALRTYISQLYGRICIITRMDAKC